MAKEMSLEEALAGFDEASAEGKLPKLQTGNYLLEITRFLFKPKGFYGPSFIIECKVIEADAKPCFASNKHMEPHKPGQGVSATIRGFDEQDRIKLAQGNLKTFLARAFGVSPDSDQKWMKLAVKCVETGALVGKRVRAQAEEKMMGSNEFVHVVWMPEKVEQTAA